MAIAEREFKRRPNVFAADALAWAYYKHGRDADARRLAAKALAHRTPDASFFYHAGMIHARLGDRAAAQRHLAEALSLNPAFDPIDAPIAAATLGRARRAGARRAAALAGRDSARPARQRRGSVSSMKIRKSRSPGE